MPIFEFLGLIFEWHDPKFELVNNERGYTIEEIASIFDDDYSVTIDDISGVYGEQRLLTTGISNQFRLITVVWVERGNTVRIITAFSPSKEQKRRYEYAKRP
ncbi:BrnT family toxin [Moraxella lincolnii]|uniref:BrnT family toxin n=1 Tax=Lwoffella lincolnii TaxID=90241 RepID=UPI0039840BD1